MSHNASALAAIAFTWRVLRKQGSTITPRPDWRRMYAGAEGPIPIEIRRSLGLPPNATWFQLAERVAVNLPGQTPIKL